MPPANSPSDTPVIRSINSTNNGSNISNDSASAVTDGTPRFSPLNERLRLQLLHPVNSSPSSSSTAASSQTYSAPRQTISRLSPSYPEDLLEEFTARTGLPSTYYGTHEINPYPYGRPEWQRDSDDRHLRQPRVQDFTIANSTTTPSASSPPHIRNIPSGGYNVERLQSIIRGEFLPRAPSPPATLPGPQQNNTSTNTSSRSATRSSSREQQRRSNAQASRNATSANYPRRWQENMEDNHNSSQPRAPRIHFPRINSSPSTFRPVEEAIKYLTKLQYTPLELSVNQSWFLGKGFPIEDFLVDASILQIPPSSYLSIGAVFDGSQYAAFVPLTHSPSLSNQPPRQPASTSGSNPSSTPVSRRPPRNVLEYNPRHEDRWNVKVTIHGIDYNTMKLSGSMYAMEVPDWQSATGTSSINTFWEGEIIDFQRHGLETLNFTSTPQIDGTYWRKLEPFAGLNDLEMAQHLVSKSFLKDLSEKWILMRWKGLLHYFHHVLSDLRIVQFLTDMFIEKCFVPPSSHESGLTISGFYFLCLNRSDGSIEGFYNDPHSSPYQQLSLKPAQRMFPAYDFR